MIYTAWLQYPLPQQLQQTAFRTAYLNHFSPSNNDLNFRRKKERHTWCQLLIPCLMLNLRESFSGNQNQTSLLIPIFLKKQFTAETHIFHTNSCTQLSTPVKFSIYKMKVQDSRSLHVSFQNLTASSATDRNRLMVTTASSTFLKWGINVKRSVISP